MASIDELSTDYDSDDGYISTNDIKNIWYGSQIHPEINWSDARFKICDHIRQTQNEGKVS